MSAISIPGATAIQQSESIKRLKTLTCGLTAGLISRSVVAPFERTIIIKQTSMSEYNGRQSMFKLLGSIYQKEALAGFFRGNAANCFRVAPTTAIEFLLYDYLKERLQTEEWLN